MIRMYVSNIRDQHYSYSGQTLSTVELVNFTENDLKLVNPELYTTLRNCMVSANGKFVETVIY